MLTKNLQNFLNYTKEEGEFIYVNLLIIDNKGESILVQKRTEFRKNFPNTWEFVGDYLRDNESIISCINRSLLNSNLQLEELLTLAHDFQWRGTAREVKNYMFLVKVKGNFTLNTSDASEFRFITKNDVSILLNQTDKENEMHRGAFFAFGYLANYIENESVNGYNFQKFMQSLLINFYEYLSLEAQTPVISICELPNGANIERDLDQNTLKVNSSILTNSNVFFGSLVVLHDLYHNVTQKIDSMTEVNAIRDLFGQNEMLMIDIDADLEIYIFFKKYYNYTFIKYLDTLYSGMTVFNDKNTRLPKLQRFIGSIISIYMSDTVNRTVYYPSLSKISNIMYLYAMSGEGIKIYKIDIVQKSVDDILKILQNPNEITKDEFIEELLKFSKNISNQIASMK